MNSHIKYSLLLTVAGCFVAMSASAKVTPIGKYMGIDHNQCKGDDCKTDLACSKKGYYDSISQTNNAICEEIRIIGNKLCYKCRCDTDKYPFTTGNCSSTGFIAPSEKSKNCNLPATDKKQDTTYYTTCNCNQSDGYFEWRSITTLAHQSAFPFVHKVNPEVKISAAYGNKEELICYNSRNYGCASGSTEHTERNAPNTDDKALGGAHIKYSFALLLPPAIAPNYNKLCTSGVTISSPLYTSNTPTACIEMKQGNITYHDKRAYYYNTGNCTSEQNCSANQPTTSCVNYATKTDKSYKNNDITCYNYTSCKYEKGSSYTCHGDYPGNSSSTKIYGDTGTYTMTQLRSLFTIAPESLGSLNCMKITGCATGWALDKRDTYGSSAYDMQKGKLNTTMNSTTHTIDQQIAYGGSAYNNNVYITQCSKPLRCNMDTSWYDVTAGTETEWLKYFVD